MLPNVSCAFRETNLDYPDSHANSGILKFIQLGSHLLRLREQMNVAIQLNFRMNGTVCCNDALLRWFLDVRVVTDTPTKCSSDLVLSKLSKLKK
jgi:hypothetical protein